MHPWSVDLDSARTLFDRQAAEFVAACEELDDLALLDPSRCRGWSRLEVVVHVRAGLEEMAACAAVPAGRPVDTDAASYWTAFLDDRDDDPVPHLMWARRTATAYARPGAAVRHLADATERVRAVVAHATDRSVLFQGHAMTMADFVATWVVELAVHQLDLLLDGPAPCGTPWARQTLEALAGTPLPSALDDADAVLAGLGRTPWPPHVERPPAYPVSL